MDLERSFGHAEQEIRRGADCDADSPEIVVSMAQGNAAPVVCREAGIEGGPKRKWLPPPLAMAKD